MSTLWDTLLRLLGTPMPPRTDSRPADLRRAAAELPRTSRALAQDRDAGRPLFDPALRQFRAAFRPGDPTFADAATAQRWAAMRRRATDHVLRAVAESLWGAGLVLRGSRLLRAWLGDQAREPGDLDWMIDPPTGDPPAGAHFSPLSARQLYHLTEAVFERPAPEGIHFDRERVASDEIWAYERAPGQRIVFPWRVPGLPGGAVQVDVVFNEALAEPAQRSLIPAADGGCIGVRAANPAQSLAWKLRWLATDMDPQGKDQFDAVLLAERFTLPRSVLEQTLRWSEAAPLPDSADEFVRGWNIDWVNFQTEYPWVEGTAGQWLDRLATALAPTFAGGEVRSSPPVDPIPLDPQWLTPTVIDLARGIAAEQAVERLPILADALQEAGCEDDRLLTHCRANGPHPRGCCVVESVLRKAE